MWELLGLDVQRERARLIEYVQASLEAQIASHRPLRWLTAEEALLPVHGESVAESLLRYGRATWRMLR